VVLTIVGHIGLDQFRVDDQVSAHLGGGMFHFLNGLAFAGVECEGVTWTSAEVARRARRRLPPWVGLTFEIVPRPPRFAIRYDGEDLDEFAIADIAMPQTLLATVGRRPELHCCAMPLGDVVALVERARPERWSLQLHSSVLPTGPELAALPLPPDLLYCNAFELDLLDGLPRLMPATTVVVTARDRVRAVRGHDVVADFAFEPVDGVVDTTGAGDILAGAVHGALRRRVPIPLALRFGAGLAALTLADLSSDALTDWWSATTG
jgi:hypothetical protein